MRHWKKILEDKEKYIDKRGKQTKKRLGLLQRLLLGVLLDRIIDELTTEGGRIKRTVGNIQKAERVNVVFRQFSDLLENGQLVSGRRKQSFIGWLIKGVQRLFSFSTEYGESIVKADHETIEQKAARLVFEQLGWKGEKIRNGSWLDSLVQSENVKSQVFSRISQAILNGADLKTFRRDFRNEMLSNKSGLGLLERHFNTHTGGFYASIDRQITQLQKEALGLNYFIYSGGIIQPSKKSSGTRPFCLEHVRRIYHDSIFDKWQGEEWKGKIPNADVRIVLGGFNCTHNAAYVSDEMAKLMIKRGRDHGLDKKQLKDLFGKEAILQKT